MTVIGNGYLKFNDFLDVVVDHKQLEVSEEALEKVQKSYNFLESFAKNRTIYGINTGFGPMARYKIEDQDVSQLQLNLIRSHAAGTGKILPELYSRASVLARLNTVALGYSGVHPEVIDLLAAFINHGVSPVIPEHGGVGASGDLVQLAHLALNLIGEGNVHYNGKIMPTSEVFKQLDLEPIDMHLREGLSLINGTSVMSGIGMVNLFYTRRLFNWMMMACAMLMEVVECYDDHYSVQTNRVKLHPAQNTVASRLTRILNGSSMVKSRRKNMYDKVVPSGFIDEKVQEFYSIRCVPQVLGPVLEAIDFTEKVLVDEINSVNDNPVVDADEEFVYHGGNFHGDYVSFEMDKMKIAVTKMTMLAERQINYLMNPKLNEKLPPFVNLGRLGFNYGMQAVQFTAVSTTAENQTLCYPNCVHSIPNNNDNQDVVSMGTNSANITRTVIENAYEVISIELMSLLQAIDYLDCRGRMSPSTAVVYDELRKVVPVFKEDTPKDGAVKAMKEHIYNRDCEV